MNRWRTLADGRIAVDFNGTGEEVPTIEGGPNHLTDRIDREWIDLLTEKAAAHGCPLAWAYGVTYAESGGDPNAKSPAGAEGLMQIMPGIHRDATHTDFFDPATNVDKGTELLGASRKRGRDLVEAAAIYNAGHLGRSSSSPWGLVTDPGYIDRVVRAANFFACRVLHGAAGGAGAVVLVALAYLAWRAAT